MVLGLLPYVCSAWVIPPCCEGPYCTAGELLGQALSYKLPLAVVKSPPKVGRKGTAYQWRGIAEQPFVWFSFLLWTSTWSSFWNRKLTGYSAPCHPRKALLFLKKKKQRSEFLQRISFVPVLPHTLTSLILLRLLFHRGSQEGRAKVLCPGHLNAFGCWLQDEDASTDRRLAEYCTSIFGNPEALFVPMGLF